MSRWSAVYDCYRDGKLVARGTVPQIASATGLPVQSVMRYRYDPRRGYEVRRAR